VKAVPHVLALRACLRLHHVVPLTGKSWLSEGRWKHTCNFECCWIAGDLVIPRQCYRFRKITCMGNRLINFWRLVRYAFIWSMEIFVDFSFYMTLGCCICDAGSWHPWYKLWCYCYQATTILGRHAADAFLHHPNFPARK
jgi:hypothetical protein